MTEITTGSIYSGTFKTIRNLINDNKVVISGVYASFPERSPIYPMCTIDDAALDQTDKTFGLTNREETINVGIDCFSKSKKQLDEIADEIEFILSSNRGSLGQSGLKNMILNSSRAELILANDEKVHMKIINLNFKWWGVI